MYACRRRPSWATYSIDQTLILGVGGSGGPAVRALGVDTSATVRKTSARACRAERLPAQRSAGLFRIRWSGRSRPAPMIASVVGPCAATSPRRAGAPVSSRRGDGRRPPPALAAGGRRVRVRRAAEPLRVLHAPRRPSLCAEPRGRRGGRPGDVARRVRRSRSLRGALVAEDMDLSDPHQPGEDTGGAGGPDRALLLARRGRR